MNYVSRYLLHAGDRRALRWTDSYSLHRIVYDLFDDVRGENKQRGSGILFVDKGVRRGVSQVVILSNRPPRPPRRGELETRELSEGYLQAPEYRFEIVANPVRRDRCSGRLVPVLGREAVMAWFCGRASNWGFEVHVPSLQVTEIQVDRFPKDNATVTLERATLVGKLTVTDRNAFIHAVCDGVGRARAFGCGLLQVMPVF